LQLADASRVSLAGARAQHAIAVLGASRSPTDAVHEAWAALAQAEKLGGTRVMGPTEVQPGIELGQFNDPEGHMVGLLKGPG
jgi:predicted enzyme related to lactoylglutathione lyase